MTTADDRSTPSATSWPDVWSGYARLGATAEATRGLTAAELERLIDDWSAWAHPHQRPPPGDWTIWALVAGRGAGKTRAGAEWVRALALGLPVAGGARAGRIALVGETHADVREVMIEGVSGLLSIGRRAERPEWSPTRRRLEWPNGAVAQAFSSEDPDALRGPEFDAAWADELAKWRHPEATFDMLQFGLRLGARPRQLVTTTPRPIPLLKAILARPDTVTTRAPTAANAANLSPAFLSAVVEGYRGTRLGRQELDGELIEARPDALFPRDDVERTRVREAPDLARVVVAVDPPASSGPGADRCGLVVAGIGVDGDAYVLADATMERAPPATWAARVASLYEAFRADRVVAEVNQGGEMVEAVLAEAAPGLPVKAVRATRGKAIRAEPVAALYARGRVHHVGTLPALEDEMADFGPGGLSSGRSPDRLDALVWALTDLMLSRPATPRVRGL